jgi:hypothetical protein
MLLIKQCWEECGVSQQQLVKATGWSKALISRVFSTGELPVDSARFTADIVKFAESTPKIAEWLAVKGMVPQQLLTDLSGGKRAPRQPQEELDLSQCIDILVGRALLAEGRDETMKTLVNMARATKYLLSECGAETEGAAAMILMGGAA